MTDMTIALELKNISKRYPGTLAVDQVNLTIKSGEVHAIIGENGAGKSTLMKIISGTFQDYSGQILLNDAEISLHSPAIAKTNGIAMIHQELCLAQPLSIAENLLAGRLPTRYGLLNRKAMYEEARQLLDIVGLDINPKQAISEISQHEAQLVEIAKALGAEPSILIMDEPTSSLSSEEVNRLFDIIRKLRKTGLTIIYISHHLPEILEIADRVTVMRDGQKVDTLHVKNTTSTKLVEMMLGQTISEISVERKQSPGEIRFQVDQCSRLGFFHDISFHIREGEILGLGGLAGAGRSEIARSLCGIDPLDAGTITLDNEEINTADMRSAMKAGLAYLSEDRKLEGLALQLTAQDNLVSAMQIKNSKFINNDNGREIFKESADQLAIYPPEPNRQIVQFSGGNQQKVLLAKWLATAPEVCILDKPTRGVDIGAKKVIHHAIAQLADQGKCILLISSDLPELVDLSDRIIVMRKGRIIRQMQKQELSEDAVLLAANGE